MIIRGRYKQRGVANTHGWRVIKTKHYIHFDFTSPTAKKIIDEWDSKDFNKKNSIWVRDIIEKIRNRLMT